MTPDKIGVILDIVSKVATAFIIICAIVARIYIARQNKNKQLIKKRRWIELLPSFISTLGVLGTFFGITVGLYFFDTRNLNVSIPLLLSGLKTAFYTSLAGMLGSMWLSRYVSVLYDEQDKGVSDINIAAGQIMSAVQGMADSNGRLIAQVTNSLTQIFNIQNTFFNTFKGDISSIKSSLTNNLPQIQAFSSNLQPMVNSLQTISSNLQSVASNVTEIKRFKSEIDRMSNCLQHLQSLNSSIAASLGNVEDYTKSIDKDNEVIKGNCDTIASQIGEISTIAEATSGTEDSILEETKKFSQFISDEVDDIERKMGETNTLLTNKFDEFSELLKKSNTEALVEVMKRLTEDFQKQMGSLIEKLVQENFDQLNKSVERLNTWQQENKAQISALINQYKNMERDFESSSTTLSKVSDDTKSLVSDGGKLQQLIDSLNKILLEDKSYMEITKSLQSAAKLNEDNMTKFDQSTNKLNEWIRKQRDFNDGVTLLINKLDELNKIRDYGEKFWQDTKKNMEQGVGIIKQGSTEIENQLTDLDQHFYERLSATLAQLDACIQAMVTAYRNR